MFKKYYQLTKPGIIYGNAMTAIAGFLLASRGDVSIALLIAMLIGLSCVIGGSCVFNNYLDRDIDDKMIRTQGRALVTGEISGRNALIFASLLLLLGVLILVVFTNITALALALIGSLVYIALYTPLKRATLYGTLVGSISGATPIVIGYCSVTNSFDLEALILFLILVIWQMPHFYAIAIRRLDEYSAASVPVLPREKGIFATKVHIIAYTAAFLIATLALWACGFAGFWYAAVMLILGLAWLGYGLKGFQKGVDEKPWAKKMFFLSLIVLTVFCFMISIQML